MTSTRPYLIRAFYEWIVDNNWTPYVVVNAGADYVDVPTEYVESGQIVLNISLMAVQGLILGQEAIEFQARFGGRSRKIYAPIPAILAIYAKENGRGMVFAEEDDIADPNLPATKESLKGHAPETLADQNAFANHSVDYRLSDNRFVTNMKDKTLGDQNDDDKGGDGGGKSKKTGDRSHLKVIK